MKNFTSLVGWLLLAAILAVPSFLFYNWWSNNKKNEAAVQVPVQSVSTATIFPGAPETPAAITQSFPQPHKTAPAATPPADNAAVSMAPVPVRKSAPQTAAPESAAHVSTAAVKSPRAAQSIAAVQASTAPAAQAHISTQTALTSYYNPKSDRDPTITPAEYRKMKEEEEARREEERQRQLALRRQPKEAGCESRITLQGIVGNNALINGDVYSVGNTVQGAKLLKIGSNYVIGECKGKRFRKVMQ
jgi:hypothetical protein